MENQNTRGSRATFKGKVVSDKMDKSRVVSVDRIVKHEKYGKYIKKTRNFMVHDELNKSRAGDTVTIVECRPMSKNKRFRIADAE